MRQAARIYIPTQIDFVESFQQRSSYDDELILEPSKKVPVRREQKEAQPERHMRFLDILVSNIQQSTEQRLHIRACDEPVTARAGSAPEKLIRKTLGVY